MLSKPVTVKVVVEPNAVMAVVEYELLFFSRTGMLSIVTSCDVVVELYVVMESKESNAVVMGCNAIEDLELYGTGELSTITA